MKRRLPRDVDTLGVPVTTEAKLIFELAWPLFEKGVENYARQLVQDTDDAVDRAEDLVQEAMIVLWRCDPTGFDFLNPKDVGYLRAAMNNRMRALAPPQPEDEPGRKPGMPASHVRALVAQLEGR